MTYFLFFSAFICGILWKRSRICTVYIATVMSVLAIYNYQNADLYNYEKEYFEALSSDSFRYIGYTSIMKICSSAGLSWIQFRWVFFILTFSLLIFGIYLLTENANLVLSLYLVTYYGIDVVQMKSFLADIVAFFAIAFLINRLRQKQTLSFWNSAFILALLLLAATVHFSAAFYFLSTILYIVIYNRENIARKVFVLSIAIMIAIQFGAISLVARIAHEIGVLSDMSYLESWFERQTRLGYLIPTVFVFAIVLSVGGIRIERSREDFFESSYLLWGYNVTSLLLIPLFIINTQYDRLIRVYLLLVLICYAEKSIRRVITKRESLQAISFAVAILMAGYYGTYAFFDTTLGAILRYSSVL